MGEFSDYSMIPTYATKAKNGNFHLMKEDHLNKLLEIDNLQELVIKLELKHLETTNAFKRSLDDMDCRIKKVF
jgi:hypothetical protein